MRYFPPAVLLLALTVATHAADAPQAPPSGGPAQSKPAAAAAVGEIPVAPSFVPGSGPITLANPIAAMNAMVDKLNKQPDIVMIEVDGRPITQGEAADAMRALPVSMASLGFQALRNRVLDQLVRQKLMVIAAEKDGLDKDPAVSRRQKSAGERALSEEWLSRKVGSMVLESAVQARYERDVTGKPGPEEVRARVILVPTEAGARELIAKARAGEDFGDLARKYSQDASAGAGGDLGFVRFEAVGPEVGAALFALAPGQVTSYPVQMPTGYLIARIEGRRQRGTPTLEEARGDLVRELQREAALTVLRDQSASALGKVTAPGQTAAPAPGQGGRAKP
jgi:peptidyl-prolyl cis-trans isomerase C